MSQTDWHPDDSPPPASTPKAKRPRRSVIVGVAIGVAIALIAAGLTGAFVAAKKTPDDQPSATSTSAKPETGLNCKIEEPIDPPYEIRRSKGWLHGGELAMRWEHDWNAGTATLPWLYDWVAQAGSSASDFPPAGYAEEDYLTGLGRIPIRENFSTPKEAAKNSLSCYIMFDFSPEDLKHVEPVFAKPIQVDGNPGYWVRSWFNRYHPETRPGVKGEMVDVVVVDTGNPLYLSMFLAKNTDDNKTFRRIVKSQIKDLRVEN